MTSNINQSSHSATTVTRHQEKWPADELKEAFLLLRGLVSTGLMLDQVMDEMARLQRPHATFWSGAAHHIRAGKPFTNYLEGRWPRELVVPMQVAESTGDLESVLSSLEQTIAEQIVVRKLLRGLYKSLIFIPVIIAAAIFFIAVVIPVLGKAIRMPNPPAILTFGIELQAFLIANGTVILIGIALGISALVYKWQDETFRTACYAQIGKVPKAGRARTWINFGIWCRYVAIMMRAGLDWQDSLRVAQHVLPIEFHAAVTRVREALQRGIPLTQAARPTPNDPEDPRQLLPIQVVNAFAMTDKTGFAERQFQQAATALYEPGAETMRVFIENTSAWVQILIAGATAAMWVPYFDIMSGMLNNIGR